MTRLAPVNFQLLDTKDNGQILVIDALPYVNPKTYLQREENIKKAKQIQNEILGQQRIAKHVMEWAKLSKNKSDLPTDDYLLIRKVGQILAENE